MKLFKKAGLTALSILLCAGIAHAQTKKWEKVSIATESSFAPWSFTSPSGELMGYEIDLANELCKRMKVECKIISYDWDGLLPGLTSKKFDAIMAGMSITNERKKAINFSRSYAQVANGFLVAKDSELAKMPGTGKKYDITNDPDNALKALEELKSFLKGKTIGVQISTTHDDFFNNYFKGTVASVKTYPTVEAHDTDLEAGRIDAVSTDVTTLLSSLEKDNFKEDYMIAGPGFVGGILGDGTGIGLRKDEPELAQLFNEALESMRADGSLKTLSLKWFKTDVTPIN